MGSRMVGVPPSGGESPLVNSKTKTDNFQTEHNKFLEDFEKPTAIYRLIRATSLANPRFLYRNLRYMKNRMKRPKRNTGGKFDLNGLLKRVEEKNNKELNMTNSIITDNMDNYLNIIIVGFSDGQPRPANTEARVDIQIMRLLSTKRKESKFIAEKAFSSNCRLPIKSQKEDSKSFSIPITTKGKFPVLHVPKEAFNLVIGKTVQSLKLVIRVTLPVSKQEVVKNSSMNGIENLDVAKSGSAINGRVSLTGHGVGLRKTNGADLSNEEPTKKRPRSSITKDRENVAQDDKLFCETVIYNGVFDIYDKDSKLNIPEEWNSDFEIRLTRQKRIRRECSWEISLPHDHSKVQEFLQRNGSICNQAKIVIAFRTTSDKMSSPATSIEPVMPSISAKECTEEEVEKENIRMVYYFVRGNTPKQSTECRNDFRCPWCSIDCLELVSLMWHLKICHPRFKFVFTPIANGARVNVSINESFDGSYTGSAYDLVAQPPGQAFGRNAPPGKRTQVFYFVAFKPKKCSRDGNSLQEFFDNDEKNPYQNRSYMIGHNRLYHHTTTCLPIHAREIDVDSEGEPDPEWLKVKTCMMIDEFTDVNEGEKEIMKMWNHHVMHDNYVGDCQISLACKKFVESYGQQIVSKNLYRNFILHLTNLFDFGLLPAQGFHTAVESLHCQMKENDSASSLKDSWTALNSSSSSRSNNPMLSNGEPMDVDDIKSEHHNNGNARNSNSNGSSKNT